MGVCAFPECGKKTAAKGLCHGHWRMKRKTGKLGPLIVRFNDPRDRIMAMTIRHEHGCWGWLGGVDRRGYALVSIGGKPRRAHRVSWEMRNGPIPAGALLMHTCDNPPCCNPDHLKPGTDAENLADMRSKGRQAKGEKHGCTRLTESDVADIRSLAAFGARHRDLAAAFDMSRRGIQAIVARVSWKFAA